MFHLIHDLVELLAIVEVNDEVNHRLAQLLVQAGQNFRGVCSSFCMLIPRLGKNQVIIVLCNHNYLINDLFS